MGQIAKPKLERPLAIDLFAGAGGLSLGFEQAGFRVVAAVENDPIHAATHEYNFPDSATICADVRNLSGDAIRAAAGIGRREIDVVFGGPPCQGFSLIGHRVLSDSRNELVFHFLRLVDELQPRAFVMENVPGMATGKHTSLLEELISQFQDLGYVISLPFRVLNAADYGVPQNRRRLFLLGSRSPSLAPEYPAPISQLRVAADPSALPLPTSDLPDCPSVGDALGDLPDIEEFPELLSSDTLQVSLRGGSAYAKLLREEARDPENFATRRKHDSSVLSGCLRAKHTATSRMRFASTIPGTTEPISRFYRLAWDGVSNTLRAGTGSDRGAFSAPRPIHPTYPRCISVREAARLHSFPDWFKFHRTIWHGFRQIGNAVPPLLARAVAASIRTHLGIQPTKPAFRIGSGETQLLHLDPRGAAAHFGISPDTLPRRRREPAETAS